MHRDRTNVATLLLTVALGSAVVEAQSTPRGGSSRPAFQSVSIEPSTSGLIDVQFAANRFTAKAATLAELIEQAYAVNAWQVIGGPEWVRLDRFTVRATTAQPVGRDQMRRLLQVLLEDRFQLQLLREPQSVSLYRLTTTSVRNLKPAGPTDRPVINVREIDNAGYRWDGRSATMGTLADALSQYLRAPVVDDTGLFGTFNFRLDFTHDDVFGNLDSDPREGPTIFAALDKQLGLKLVADKGLIPGIVIRRASKPSS